MIYWNMAIPVAYGASVVVFMIQWQSGVVVAVTEWPPRPKIFAVWPFTKKSEVLLRFVRCGCLSDLGLSFPLCSGRHLLEGIDSWCLVT